MADDNDEYLNWDDAQAVCERDHANLAVINSEAEAQVSC